MTAVALTIAGSDPSGGAGLQADLKTFHAHGVYGASAVTLLTVQNTRGVTRVEVLDPELVVAQIEAVVADLAPAAAKTGALGSAAVIEAVAAAAETFAFPLVVDPVMVSKHGDALLAPDAEAVLRERLLPRAYLVTPNLLEAERLLARSIGSVEELEQAARAIAALGPRHVLAKGGARLGGELAVDVLWSQGRSLRLSGARTQDGNTHGSGCVLSAAVAARIARGEPLERAVRLAVDFARRAVSTGPSLGGGIGPANTLVRAEELGSNLP